MFECGDHVFVFIIPGFGFEGVKFEVPLLRFLGVIPALRKSASRNSSAVPNPNRSGTSGKSSPDRRPWMTRSPCRPSTISSGLILCKAVRALIRMVKHGSSSSVTEENRASSVAEEIVCRITDSISGRVGRHSPRQPRNSPAFAEAEGDKASAVLDQARGTGGILGDTTTTQVFLEGVPGDLEREPLFLWADGKHRVRSLCL